MMKFKTNAKCNGCVAAISSKFEGIVDAGDWSVDLSSPNKVLTVKADVPAEVVIAAVKEAGLKAALLEE